MQYTTPTEWSIKSPKSLSIDGRKEFNRTQHNFKISKKSLYELDIEGMYLNITKFTYIKARANSTLFYEKQMLLL